MTDLHTRALRLVEDMRATGATFVQTGDGKGTADSLRLLDRRHGVTLTLSLMSPTCTITWHAKAPDRDAALDELMRMVSDLRPAAPCPAGDR